MKTLQWAMDAQRKSADCPGSSVSPSEQSRRWPLQIATRAFDPGHVASPKSW
jgi:hypothetical protein